MTSDWPRHRDRAKLPAYARSGIPEVWFADINEQVLLRHLEPSGAEYRVVQALRSGEAIEPRSLGDLRVEVDTVLG